MDIWTPAKVGLEYRRLFGNTKLILGSNREPYSHQPSPTGIKCERPAGGLTSALDPVMQALGGTWVAWGSGKADRETVDSNDRVMVPPDSPSYPLRRVWLTQEEIEGYYNGFSNQTLWPLSHMLVDKARFRWKFWQAYQKVNQNFAEIIAREAAGPNRPIIWLQDYHLALAPRQIRKYYPDAFIALFWHIPWPAWEHFRILPQRVEILEGLLGCDLIGFHLKNFYANFLECASRELDARVDPGRRTVSFGDHRTQVGSFPISIDEDYFRKIAESSRTEKRMERLRARKDLRGRWIGIGVDRMDYSKGILERLTALEFLFERYPQYRNRLTFVQVSAPSRTRIKAYQDLRNEVCRRIEAINTRYRQDNWTPIIHITEKLTQEELAAYYRLADIAIISSLQDGMNLVVKEYIACQVEEKGVILLSEFAGAADEMSNVIPINPYDGEDFAWKIKSALELPPAEKKRRMRSMRSYLRVNNIYRWIGGNLRAMHQNSAWSKVRPSPATSLQAISGVSVASISSGLPPGRNY